MVRALRTYGLVLALLAAPLLGCGGGSNNNNNNNNNNQGGNNNALLNGTYIVTVFESFFMAGNTETTFGSVAFDGAGMFTPTVGTNNDGAVTPPMLMPAQAYTVAADGTLTIPDQAGGVTNDGFAAVFMNTTNMSSPELGFIFKPTGVFGQGTFNGNYHSGQLIASTGGAAQSIWTTTAQGLNTSAGAGMMTLPANVMTNAAGAVGAAATGGGMAPYTVMANGAMQLFMLGMIGEGGIVADGSFGVYAGGSDGGSNPQIAAYVRQSAGATNAAFNGSYWAVGICSDPTDMNRWRSFFGTVTADGAGNMNYASTTENFEGAISTPTGPDMYNVGGDGTLTSSGGARIGAITQDGRFAFQCGDTQMNGPPMLFLFVRK